MRVWGIVIAAAALAVAPWPAPAVAQDSGGGGSSPPAGAPPTSVLSQLPAGSLQMSAAHCVVWETDDGTQVVELTGSPRIQVDQATLTAKQAVVWIRPAPHALLDEQLVEIALLGNAKLQQANVTRTDRNLLVRADVTGTIRLSGVRTARDDSDSFLYHAAALLRSGHNLPATAPATRFASTGPASTGLASTGPATTTASTTEAATEPSTQPTPSPGEWSETPPATQPVAPPATRFVDFEVGEQQTETDEHGNLCAVVSGGVTLRYGDAKGNLLEFVADRGVLFTNLKTVKGAGQGQDFKRFIAQHVVAAYFEGDVRVFSTPADQSKPELRMRAERMYYELASDRAVMTDVVFHTVDMQKNLPMIMRAKVMRQLSSNEWSGQDVQLTTSSFAAPDYELGASSAYVRSETVDTPVADERPGAGEAITFNAQDATFRAFGVPLFYFPNIGGTVAGEFPLRQISLGNSSDFGFGFHTDWGLFESLGKVPPKDTDVSYRLDYFSARGPAGGVDAKYAGGVVDDTTKQPFDFSGDLHAYFVDDHGYDVLGGIRPNEKPPSEFTGRAYLEHQFFFPDNWQAQVRLGWISDDNFQQQWFPQEFWQDTRIDESLYLKHTNQDEVFTLLGQWQPNDVVTTSDDVPAQREVEHLPELAYDREGAPLLDNNLTLYSENSASALKFAHSAQTLGEQGFIPGFGPGEPAFAYTGDPGTPTYRGDFREELDYPIAAGPFKLVPYVFGRYTPYSQGVLPGQTFPRVNPTQRTLIPVNVITTGEQNRFMGGAGVRVSTEFWHVDDTAESDLFDIHRIRHVIEPQLNLFTSAQTIDQNRLFIYDPDVDAINDIQAVDLALLQRWQTKRGGPGRWRSTDFFTWNLEADLYANQPSTRFRDPVNFRGLYFSSEPEFSQARNSINSDELWRLSDTTAILSDLSHNLDTNSLATASIGFAAMRADLVSYYLGARYINDLHSTFGSTEINYNLTRKYNLDLSASIDLQTSRGVFYAATLTRRFDRYSVSLQAYYDQNSNSNGFSFTFQPYGFGRGLGSSQLNQPTSAQ